MSQNRKFSKFYFNSFHSNHNRNIKSSVKLISKCSFIKRTALVTGKTGDYNMVTIITCTSHQELARVITYIPVKP